MNVVETRGLTKSYRGKRAVDRLDLHVAQGDIYGFVGKNGAGKSTVMKMVCGLATPDEGEIELFGSRADECGRPEGAPRVGALIEAPGLVPNLSAYENLMAKALAMGVADAPARCRETLALVGLDGVGKKKAKGFSLGMKQRLGLALALVGSPDLLLLDEPLNGLDPEGTRAMRNLIVRLAESLGITVVVSSHVLDQLERVATRYGVIADGRMVREMTAEEVAAECRSSLRVRTENPARALALLEEAYPALAFKAEPDGALVVAGDYDDGAISRLLARSGEVVRELSQDHRDLEEYFVELMEGGAQYV